MVKMEKNSKIATKTYFSHFVVKPKFMCPTHSETKQTQMVGLEQSKIDGRAKQGEPAAHAQKP